MGRIVASVKIDNVSDDSKSHRCDALVDTQVSTVRTDDMQHLRLMTTVETAMIDWLNKSGTPTLGERLISHSLDPGDFFTHYGSFYGKGVLAAANCYALGKPLPEARLK